MCCRPVAASASIRRDLVGGRDRPGLDLEALARAFLMDVDMAREIGHGRPPLAGFGRESGAGRGDSARQRGAAAGDSTRATLPRPAPPGTRRVSQEETKR